MMTRLSKRSGKLLLHILAAYPNGREAAVTQGRVSGKRAPYGSISAVPRQGEAVYILPTNGPTRKLELRGPSFGLNCFFVFSNKQKSRYQNWNRGEDCVSRNPRFLAEM